MPVFSLCSARPVYLQEVYGNHGDNSRRKKYSHPIAGETIASKTSAVVSPTTSPPERPPKKPHLRSSRENSPPPQTPPRGQTPSVPSRPPSRTSPVGQMPVPGSAHSSRVSTPNLFRSTSSSTTSSRCRPKFPSPPTSPTRGASSKSVRRPTDDLPLPPPPTDMNESSNDLTITADTSDDSGAPGGKEGDDKPTLR